MTYLTALIIFSLLPVVGNSQDQFSRLDFLIGNWQGVESGISGDGIGFRTYGYELGDNFIVVKNQSTFPKTEEKPKGEVHRDFGVFSFNSNKNETVYRSFNIENFTNVFLLEDSVSNDAKFVFITREIENGPANMKARLTIEKISDTEFMEYFDIAMDGKNFKPILQNHWYKVK